jgi:hypothetical protein
MEQQDMQVFRIFSNVIRNLPAPAILRALDAECHMLEDDVERYRFNLTEDILSILCFRGFVTMAKTDTVMRCSLHMPPEHIEFYKETINRLIQTGDLRPSAMEQFDFAFRLQN